MVLVCGLLLASAASAKEGEEAAGGGPGTPRALAGGPLTLALRATRVEGLIDDLDVKILLGPSWSRGLGISTPAISVVGEASLDHARIVLATVRAQISHDLTPRSSDPVRVKDWYVLQGRAWVHPFRWGRGEEDRLSAGLAAFTQVRENTPSSEEHTIEFGGGPSIGLDGAGYRLRLGGGYYAKAVEFDDDLPRTRGQKPPAGRYYVADGPFVMVEASLQVNEALTTVVTATCLLNRSRLERVREARANAQLELDVSKLLWRAPTSAWELVVTARVEARHFDSEQLREHLGFRHDVQAGIFIGLRRAPRPRSKP